MMWYKHLNQGDLKELLNEGVLEVMLRMRACTKFGGMSVRMWIKWGFEKRGLEAHTPATGGETSIG